MKEGYLRSVTRVVLMGGLVGLVAASAFAQGSQPAPFETVVAQLKSDDPVLRRGALRSLGESGYPEAIGPISTLLRDPLRDIKQEALDTLVRVFMQAPLPSRRYRGPIEVRHRNLAETAFGRGRYALIPHQVPNEAVENLAWAMADQDWLMREQAVYALGVMRPSAGRWTAQALVRTLEDSDARVRRAGARVAGALRVRETGEALVEAMNDRDDEVRLAAMRALGDIGEWRALEALTNALTFYERGALAEAALDGLAGIAHVSSQELFRARLTDRSPEMRRAAVEGLARSGNRAAAQTAVAELASDRDEGVRVAVAFASIATGGSGEETLVDALRHDARHLQAMDALVELGGRALPSLRLALEHQRPVVRRRAAEVLGFIEGSDALTLLESAEQDGDAEVARAAALARQRHPEVSAGQP